MEHSCGCVWEPEPPSLGSGLGYPAEAARWVAICSLAGLWRGKALTTPRLSSTACISSDVETLLHEFKKAAGK